MFGGEARKGDNLYTGSVLALDMKTGRLRWHYQVVHHDLWDADIAIPHILYDTTVNGRPRKGMAAMRADGYLFLLDRETGKPLAPDRRTAGDAGSLQQHLADAAVPGRRRRAGASVRLLEGQGQGAVRAGLRRVHAAIRRQAQRRRALGVDRRRQPRHADVVQPADRLLLRAGQRRRSGARAASAGIRGSAATPRCCRTSCRRA